MKNTTLTATLLLTALILSTTAPAQDYTRWGLPDGAKLRLGKGELTGEIAYSPDGKLLAVASAIGVWLYDARTFQEVALLFASHAGTVNRMHFSPDGEMLVIVSRAG